MLIYLKFILKSFGRGWVISKLAYYYPLLYLFHSLKKNLNERIMWSEIKIFLDKEKRIKRKHCEYFIKQK